MTTLGRLSTAIAITIALIVVVFCIGQETEKQKSLKAAIAVYENSREVENEVEALTPYQRCLAIGGVPDECKILLRGLDKTTQGK